LCQGSQKVCFRFSIFGISSQISQPVDVRAAFASGIFHRL